ncbi:putative secreted lipase [Dissophora ornata]|nr:putative secreted lipase [Dissophora ornata]
MKFTISSVLSASSAAILVALSAIQVAALPMKAGSPVTGLVKRDIAGMNDYSCQLTTAHPRPLILIHSTLLTVDSWWEFAPVLIENGYCVFGLTYGLYPTIPGFGGLASVESSAQELATFADNVLTQMNVTQVDIVGHSQGGILARYWMKYLEGAGKVYRHIGISPITHGTTLDSLTIWAEAWDVFAPLSAFFNVIAPSFPEMVANSTFMNELNDGGDTASGVIFSNIATKYDEVVTPYTTCFQEDTGVTNVVLQNLCALSLNEHLTMINSFVVLRFVLNQLDPSNAKTANCLNLLSA